MSAYRMTTIERQHGRLDERLGCGELCSETDVDLSLDSTLRYDLHPIHGSYVVTLCGTVQGSSWYDVNGDCVHDVNEVGIPYSPMLIQPGGQVALTGFGGGFTFPLTNGAYTLEQANATLIPICPAAQPVPFTVNSDIQTLELANGSTVPLDPLHRWVAWPGPSGFRYPIILCVGAQPITAIERCGNGHHHLRSVARLPGTAWPQPTDVTGNTVTWTSPR